MQFDISIDEYKGAMHFCEYLRRKVDAGQLSAAWCSYQAEVMKQWQPKEENAA